MKRVAFALAFTLLTGATNVWAEKIVGGPKGGRLLEAEGLKAEFFVEKDKTVNVTFYDESLKKVPVTTQSATAIADAPTGKTTIEFEKKNDELVSTQTLPEGDGYTVVVRIKPTADSTPKNFRIPLETHVCGECGRAEYACTCDEH
jgi:hypothetical protein